jgi:L-seryl-tRNA(Ser) seleniumtransferase
VNDRDRLAGLPAVHEVLDRLADLLERFPRRLVVEEIRRALAAARAELVANPAAGPPAIEDRVREAIAALEAPSLRRVINATGVVLHTNLGRAPLGAFEPIRGYSNLEYDLGAGRRGKRDTHLTALFERLLGKPGLIVNNNAAAVFLTLHELAAGYEVIVSRGELIEIGDGFRIPDIMARSGAILREVGTTNKTHLEDYRRAINERTRLILTVHQSNFRMTGFTAQPALKDLAALARQHAIPLYQDLGSGCLADLTRFGIDEPMPQASLAAGANLVSFSGDKLLGGPQAGVIAGDANLLARLRKNPMFRALRADKLCYQAMETALRHLLLGAQERIPALAMIAQSAGDIRRRAEALLARIPELPARIEPGVSVIGGGATPEQPLPTFVIAVEVTVAAEFERRLRAHSPPVIARIEDDRVKLDLRTVFADEEAELLSALRTAL